MKKIIIVVFILTTLFFILNTLPIFAQSKILINEFLIDPQPQSVEIFNSGSQSADISDWVIDDSGGSTFFVIPKESVIFPNQCLVFSSDFNLNKSSADTIKLINISKELVDFFSYKSSSGSGISYFRFPDSFDNWSTGAANLGLYNQTGISCLAPPPPTPSPTPTITVAPTSKPIVTEPVTPTPTLPTVVPTEESFSSYDNIYLSEVMVAPPTGEKEWVEIYNDNDFPVSLNNWYIDDIESSGSSPKKFSLTISRKSYGVFDISSSMFNNSGDTVRLLDFNKKPKDGFEYTDAKQGKTLGRISFASDNFCLEEPSKNSSNQPCIEPSPTVTPTPTMIVAAGQITPSPTANIIREKISIPQVSSYTPSSNVLGATNKLIINPPNNKSLIKLMSFLSLSYSLLTIISILFKMKLTYGKDKNFFTPPLHSS
jgi:hypothetical protein